MNRDFIIGFLLGVLIVLLLTWPKDDDEPEPDNRARQGAPRERGMGDAEYLEVLRKAAGQ